MKLLFVIPSLHGGGTERGVRSWASLLCEAGHEVHVATYMSGPHDFHLDLDLADVRWEHHDLSATSGHTRIVLGLRRLIAALAPDVVVPSLTYTNILVLTAVRTMSRRPRTLLVEHNSPGRLLRTEGISGRAKLLSMSAMYRAADGVVAVSHPALADVAATAGLKGDRLFVVPNPILHRRQPIRVLPRHVDVLFVGRLEPPKRPQLVLDVVRVLSSTGISATATFVGDGSLRSQLEDNSAGLPCEVAFHGWVESWSAVLTGLPRPVLLLPSVAEGFGNVLVEAAARGIPSVAPASALGTGEAIVPNVTGIPAVSSSAVHLADAVQRAAGLSLADGRPDDWLDWFSAQNSARVLEDVLHAISLPADEVRDAPAD